MTSDEIRKAAFVQAKAKSMEMLARVADISVTEHDPSAEYWQRPKPAPAPVHQPHQPSVAEIEALRSQDWARFVDSRISAALDEHDERWRAILGGLVSEVRKQLRSEFQEQLGLLRADVEIATKAAERRERGDVVELPEFIQRRRHG